MPVRVPSRDSPTSLPHSSPARSWTRFLFLSIQGHVQFVRLPTVMPRIKQTRPAYIERLCAQLCWKFLLQRTLSVRDILFLSPRIRLTRLQGRTVDTSRLLIRDANACFSLPASAPLTVPSTTTKLHKPADGDAPSLEHSCRLPGTLFVYVTCVSSNPPFQTFPRYLLSTPSWIASHLPV